MAIQFEADVPGQSKVLRGVDGCKKGWIGVSVPPDGPILASVDVWPRFEDAAQGAAVVAIDMPIGLPDNHEGGGRMAERTARSVLDRRKSSVFSIPPRAVVSAEPDLTAPYVEQFRKVLGFARGLNPAIGFSIQAFGIFPKIREVDQALLRSSDLRSCVFETHPEIAFWQLNARRAMRFGKSKPEGIRERRDLLERHGFAAAFLDGPIPRGAKRDDFLDACVCALVARRLHAGLAQSFPDPPGRDAHGLPVAIWS